MSSVNLLSKPASHKSKLWVFEHKSEVSSLEVPESSGYCANCHNSGASLISHDEMLFRHPEAIAEAGLKACQYCHQPASCARCHKNDSVLESERPSPHRESPLRGEPE